MTKRFYLATRKDRSAQANELSEILKTHGWERTFVWTDEGALEPNRYAATAMAELQAVREADVLIVLLPGGFGTHVEIGAALALGKRVIIHASDRKVLDTPYPCVFHYHPSVTLLVSDALDPRAVVACVRSSESGLIDR